MTIVLPITGSPNWDSPLNTALLNLQTQAQAAQTTANSAITTASTKVIKDSLVFNVKDHGAVGNGATDDTTAVQATINLAGASGGIAFFPTGTYNISASLTLSSNVIIAGSNSGTTLIKQNSTSSDAFVLNDAISIRFQNLRIQGPGSGSGRGIRFTTISNPTTSFMSMQDVVVSAFGGDGISISLPLTCDFNRVAVSNCGGYGMNFIGVNFPTTAGISISSSYLSGCTTGGLRMFRATNSHIRGTTAVACGIGYLIDSCDGIVLDGSGAQGCTTGVKFNGGSSNSVYNHFNYDNKGIAIQATSTALGVGIYQAVELTPNVLATRFIQVDAGSYATIIGAKNVTANLFTGTTHILDDGALGNIVAAGDIKAGTVGKTLYIKEGTNAKMGTSSLVAGTVVVNTTAVTASSRIFLTPQNTSGTAGAVSVSTRTAGTSFTMLSTSNTDTRSIAWFIVEPA